MSNCVLQTGPRQCFDAQGRLIDCHGSGQDGEFRFGIPWPEPRFARLDDDLVRDELTGLIWARNANLAEFPLTWQESLDFVSAMNGESRFGHSDWRLPNRRELRSLMDYQARKPSLPEGHPFVDVFLGWYWTSTTSAMSPAYAWYVHMEGARMFYGRKDQYYLLWPVRGRPENLARTGQHQCFDVQGGVIDCRGSGQDGELRLGVPWPEPRFEEQGETVLDRLTGLRWLKNADLTGAPVGWSEALDAVADLNKKEGHGRSDWRLPNINELESLVDCSRHSPALPSDHPFEHVREVYWSSTTSFFETDWAWALYMHKGAAGVGFKTGKTFFAWPVCGG